MATIDMLQACLRPSAAAGRASASNEQQNSKNVCKLIGLPPATGVMTRNHFQWDSPGFRLLH